MEIKRVPIKIRKPILLDTCTCYGQKVIAINGEPKLIEIDSKQASDMMNDVASMLPISIYNRPDVKELEEIMKYKVPAHVWVGNDIDYGFEVLTRIKDVPHSVMIFKAGHTMDFVKLRELLSLAKTHKVMTTMWLAFLPNTTSKIELFSEIEQVKNFISHLLIQGPIKKSMMLDIEKYLKERKITCEWLENASEVNGKVRFISNINDNLPLGIRTFSYNKDNSVGAFVEGKVEEQVCCQKCQKPIF